MKLQFKVQPYQTNAVEAVLDCFAGQPKTSATGAVDEAFKNRDIALTDRQILANIQEVQRRQNLPISETLIASNGCGFNLDVEMETGTGKTYCYIKTIFEMNKRYGWAKFIVMAPSIAIREGISKSLRITAGHFAQSYAKTARCFIYNSKRLDELERFSLDAGIAIMVFNIQAFGARRADNRRIYDELDDLQSRRPIDVIASNRPILILDEPQKMEGRATMAALPQFRPLMILRYSATHRTAHNMIHRLDALDAYNQKLVKKIAVRGIETRGLAGTNAYLRLEGIDVSHKSPMARIDLEVKLKSGEIGRELRRIGLHEDLFVESGELDSYRGFTVSQIDCNHNVVEFSNGIVLKAGVATGDVSERDIRRIQIRETIRAHLEKEEQLFALGIKVLSLFFIDEVVKYRDYGAACEKGEYARIFEDEYELIRADYLSEPATGNEAYRTYLAGIHTAETHNGYFSIDRKTGRLKDPAVGPRSVDSDDVDAYDLILKDKERLLSFDEPTRFIFSHSALREGWDNPNVFVICMLKNNDNTMSRRQEVGRGLRLSVDQHGMRMDDPAFVHDINVLTVVASESYREFVGALQKEMSDALSSRPRHATEAYFTGKMLPTAAGLAEMTPAMAKQLYRYLRRNGYTDDTNRITKSYHEAREAGTLADLPAELRQHAVEIFKLIDGVFGNADLPEVADGRTLRTNPLNESADKRAFRDLWARINRKSVYRVAFDPAELVGKCVDVLDSQLRVSPLRYKVEGGIQQCRLTDQQLKADDSFRATATMTELGGAVHSRVKYDLVGKLADGAGLTRRTTAAILNRIDPDTFDQFRKNPEHFISKACRIIAEQKATTIIERLDYDVMTKQYGVEIFTANQAGPHFSHASGSLAQPIWDDAATGPARERCFVEDIDGNGEVVVYAKLPHGFLIPTPLGDYNPDWAFSLVAGGVKSIYFVAETKGSLTSLTLHEIGETKIACAGKFLDEIGRRISDHRVKYDVVTSYAKLMEIVGDPRGGTDPTAEPARDPLSDPSRRRAG